MTRRELRKHIACLESLWSRDLEKRLSVAPILELVSRADGVRYAYFTCNTPGELEHDLEKLRRLSRYRILYFSCHGHPGEILLDGAPVALEALAKTMARGFSGRIVHFGTCSTIAVSPRRIRSFIAETGVAMVLGYRGRVSWIASAALDLLLFHWLQYYSDMRRLWAAFRRRYRDLVTATGLQAFHR
jgi:hypothetical protein